MIDILFSPRSSYYRSTVCWSCHEPINNAQYPECPLCRWIICPQCGACSYDCICSIRDVEPYRFRRKIRSVLRSSWIQLDKKPADVEYWALPIIDRVISEEEQREREEQEQAAIHRKEYASELRERITPETLLYAETLGDCTFVKYQGDSLIVISTVRDGKKETFIFPDSFMNGTLRILSQEDVDARKKNVEQQRKKRIEERNSWQELVASKGTVIHKRHGTGSIRKELSAECFLVDFDKAPYPMQCNYSDFEDGTLAPSK